MCRGSTVGGALLWERSGGVGRKKDVSQEMLPVVTASHFETSPMTQQQQRNTQTWLVDMERLRYPTNVFLEEFVQFSLRFPLALPCSENYFVFELQKNMLGWYNIILPFVTVISELQQYPLWKSLWTRQDFMGYCSFAARFWFSAGLVGCCQARGGPSGCGRFEFGMSTASGSCGTLWIIFVGWEGQAVAVQYCETFLGFKVAICCCCCCCWPFSLWQSYRTQQG